MRAPLEACSRRGGHPVPRASLSFRGCGVYDSSMLYRRLGVFRIVEWFSGLRVVRFSVL